MQRIANKTRPVYKESFFFRMMIACHQTKRPANSGYSPMSSSWDIGPRIIIGVRNKLLESDDVRFMPHFSLRNWSQIKNCIRMVLWGNTIDSWLMNFSNSRTWIEWSCDEMMHMSLKLFTIHEVNIIIQGNSNYHLGLAILGMLCIKENTLSTLYDLTFQSIF